MRFFRRPVNHVAFETHKCGCFYLFVVCVCARTQVWRTENNMQELDLSLHHVSSRDQAQIVGPDSKLLYLLCSNSATPVALFLHCNKPAQHRTVLVSLRGRLTGVRGLCSAIKTTPFQKGCWDPFSTDKAHVCLHLFSVCSV